MKVIECSQGHLYNPEEYASCPYCQRSSAARIDFAPDAPGSTVQQADIGATVAPAAYREQVANSDIGKTVGIFQNRMKFEPAVGWLVCIKGAEKGADHRIYSKNNTIGRDESNDICIRSEPTMSRSNHARIAYDEKHNVFHLIPADGTNIVYLNDEPVYVPTKLSAYDIIEFGESRYLFIPLCSERFTWKQNEEA